MRDGDVTVTGAPEEGIPTVARAGGPEGATTMETTIACHGCPGTGEVATRTYRDVATGATVRYCDGCGDDAECGWNGREYVRIDDAAAESGAVRA